VYVQINVGISLVIYGFCPKSQLSPVLDDDVDDFFREKTEPFFSMYVCLNEVKSNGQLGCHLTEI